MHIGMKGIDLQLIGEPCTHFALSGLVIHVKTDPAKGRTIIAPGAARGKETASLTVQLFLFIKEQSLHGPGMYVVHQVTKEIKLVLKMNL
jgi:hypothetical protein